MTKAQAFKNLLRYCKRGIQWHDQFQGHGHWEFHLDDMEFQKMFEAMKVADGHGSKSKDVKKVRKIVEKMGAPISL